MKRRSVIPVLAAVPAALSGAGYASAQPETSAIVGAWIVREMLPPNGGTPPLFFVISFFADGNATLSGFGGYGGGGHGVWAADEEGAVTFTMVAPTGTEASNEYELLRATVMLEGGDRFTGGYETNLMVEEDGQPKTNFTYMGPLAGDRMVLEAPDPKVMTIQPGATPAP